MSTTNTPPTTPPVSPNDARPANYGVKETTELLRFAGALAKVVKLGIKGEIKSFNVIGPLMQIMPTIQPAFEGIGDVDDELRELDREEINQILQVLTEETGQVFDSVANIRPYISIVRHCLGIYQNVQEIRS